MKTCSVTGCRSHPNVQYRTRCADHVWAHRAPWTDERRDSDWGAPRTGRTPRHRA